MSRRDRARCPFCDGLGHRRVTPAMQDTLDLVRALGDVKAKDLARKMGISHVTAIGRLNSSARPDGSGVR